MNKKGFTLVELLAVIAIMAILVVIAMPNVLEALNRAKRNSFIDDIYTLYNTAKTQYSLDKSDETNGLGRNITYCSSRDLNSFSQNCSPLDDFDCSNSLTLKVSGNNANYVVKVNKDGQVVYMYVNNEVFDYKCNDESSCKTVVVKSFNDNCVEMSDNDD
jgi:prepilin-type N-terminal cleavage/methylation domain-containing protein